MPKLIKKVREGSSSGTATKRKKNGCLGFNPRIHVKVKTENSMKIARASDDKLSSRDSSDKDQDLSSLTIPSVSDLLAIREAEERKEAAIFSKLQSLFVEENQALTLPELLEGMNYTKEDGKVHSEDSGVSVQKEVLPVEIARPTIIEHLQSQDIQEGAETGVPKNDDNDQGVMYERIGEVVVPNTMAAPGSEVSTKCCGGCKMEFKWIESRESILSERFHGNLNCVRCAKTVYACMTKGKNKGAYICNNCTNGTCKQMHCIECYHLHAADRSRRTRTRKKH